ncbi:MAG: hypothetical protein JXA92_08850 [candidate division Zixibacteria bacterium]|nr:hypothetical protein [candidate division Zixibacteria bacterium]
MIKIFRIYLLAFLALVTFSCGSDKVDTKGADYTPIEYFDECLSYEYDFPELAYAELPNIGYSLATINDTTLLRDSDGVVLFEYKEQYYYHPVNMSHRMFILLGAYYKLKDTVYLHRAEKYAQRLMQEALEYNNAVYFPYRFDYKVHNREDGQLRAPWYSGMAQGEALEAIVRLFEFTGDSTYLKFARKIFNSLTLLKDEYEPWVSFVDERGCFWIEEYTVDPPSMTLNGFIAAMFGVYDYYRATGSKRAELMLADCCNTVRNYMPLFRRPGRISYYNLRFQHYDAGYHIFHIKLLRDLSRLSGDPVFNQWADSLQADYNG